jgi:hypothetical protein
LITSPAHQATGQAERIAAMNAYDEDALLTARNKFATVHLALSAIAEKAPDHEDDLLCVERVFDEAMRDLDRGLKLAVTEAA